MTMSDRHPGALVVLSLAAAGVLAGCAMPSAGTPTPAAAAPEDLLLDVGIAVFDVSNPALDDDSAFKNDEVRRAERNYLPYVIGKHLQARQVWGAVRVVPRPSAAIDVTITGTITHSDGETLVFRARATDARGVEWFDNEYRAEARPGAYDVDDGVGEPFAAAYAALADRRRHYNPLRPSVTEFIGMVQEDIYYGDFDHVVDTLRDLLNEPSGRSRSSGRSDIARSLGVFRLRPAERAALYQALARAYVGKRDYDAARETYRKILAMGTKAPPWHKDISNENLALIHFANHDYEGSLRYQRDWLETASWVGEACPKACPTGQVESRVTNAVR